MGGSGRERVRPTIESKCELIKRNKVKDARCPYTYLQDATFLLRIRRIDTKVMLLLLLLFILMFGCGSGY